MDRTRRWERKKKQKKIGIKERKGWKKLGLIKERKGWKRLGLRKEKDEKDWDSAFRREKDEKGRLRKGYKGVKENYCQPLTIRPPSPPIHVMSSLT